MKFFKDSKTKEKGFTLVELIVATLILVVAVIPILSSFVISQRMNMKGRQREQAMTVAQNIVETVKAVGAKTAKNMAEEGLANAMGSGTIALVEGSVNEDMITKPGINVNGSVQSVTYKNFAYQFTVEDYIMGQTKYDAKVSVMLDASEDQNLVAYAYQGYYDTLKLPVMKYYLVVAEVWNDGTPQTGTPLATYTGSFVTKN